MSTTTSDLGDKVMSRLRCMSGLSDLLMVNDSFKDEAQEGLQPQFSSFDEATLHESIRLLAEDAQDHLLNMMNAAGGTQ
jgi:Mg2+ and Co2+ transporter CorA